MTGQGKEKNPGWLKLALKTLGAFLLVLLLIPLLPILLFWLYTSVLGIVPLNPPVEGGQIGLAERGQFGDMFGVVGAAAAIVAAVLAYDNLRQLRKQNEQQQTQLDVQQEQIKQQAEETAREHVRDDQRLLIEMARQSFSGDVARWRTELLTFSTEVEPFNSPEFVHVLESTLAQARANRAEETPSEGMSIVAEVDFSEQQKLIGVFIGRAIDFHRRLLLLNLFVSYLVRR